MKRFWVVLLSLVAAHAAQAQTIYRCGPQGREYSQLPCKDGRPIEPDTRTPAQRAEALQVAEDDARRAEALRRERHARERAAKPAAGFANAATQDDAAPPPKQKKPQARKTRPARSPAR
jgi:hypothetical protein